MDPQTPAQARILEALKPAPQRAQDLAALLHVDTSAVRRHMATLTALGLVESYDVVEGPGRPKRHYRLSAAGRELGPKNYPLLLAALMQKVARDGGRRALLRYLRDIAEDLAGSATKAASGRKRLDALLARYNELGFEASAEKEGAAVLIKQRNCPFLAAATGDPGAICRGLDEAMIRAALPGGKVRLESCMATGDHVCVHRVTFPGRGKPEGTAMGGP